MSPVSIRAPSHVLSEHQCQETATHNCEGDFQCRAGQEGVSFFGGGWPFYLICGHVTQESWNPIFIKLCGYIEESPLKMPINFSASGVLLTPFSYWTAVWTQTNLSLVWVHKPVPNRPNVQTQTEYEKMVCGTPNEMPRYATIGQFFHIYPKLLHRKDILDMNDNFSCYLKIARFLNEEKFYDPRDWLFRILNSDKV